MLKDWAANHCLIFKKSVGKYFSTIGLLIFSNAFMTLACFGVHRSFSKAGNPVLIKPNFTIVIASQVMVGIAVTFIAYLTKTIRTF